MKIILTEHAKQRMAQRGITVDDLFAVLLNPRISLPGRPSGTCYVGEGANGASLQVCIVGQIQPGQPVTIKSAYWKDAS